MIANYLDREVQLGRMHRHVVSPPGVHLSPRGYSQEKQARKVVSDHGLVLCDHLSCLVLEAGKGAVLVKADIKEAYMMLSILPDDQNLLGVQWKDERYTDGALPFGLRSAPKIFSAVADALQWILTKKGICCITGYSAQSNQHMYFSSQSVSHK